MYNARAMHAFLFIGGTQKNRQERLYSELESQGIPDMNRIFLVPTDKPSVGIREVREFIHMLQLIPANGTHTAGVIPQANLLTNESQQALLKTIEEPPKHVRIFIGAENQTALLPTIVSRCRTIMVADSENAAEDKTVTDLLRTIRQAPPGKKLLLIEGIGKTKEECAAWIDRAIFELGRHPERDTSVLLHGLFSVKDHAARNVSPYHLLERLFLSEDSGQQL